MRVTKPRGDFGNEKFTMIEKESGETTQDLKASSKGNQSTFYA